MPKTETPTRVALLGDKIEPGHCVIINTTDRPCTKLIAVVKTVENETVVASYITTETSMRQCYARAQSVTPLARFGVQAIIEGGVVFVAHSLSLEPTATYPDDRPRRWQGDPGETRNTRSEIAERAIKHALAAG